MSNLKPCPACRALIDAGEELCPYCGAQVDRRSVREVRLARQDVPGALTGYLIGICVLFFLLEMVASLGALGSQGLWRALLNVPGEILFNMGARATGRILVAGEWWRIIVPIFLHGNFIHLLFNGMALMQVGPLAEQAYGRPRFILIFILSGAFGFLLGAFLSPTSISIGASGSLFGLIGAAGVYGHRRGDSFGRMIRGIMVQWGIYALLFGLLIRADNAAHVGGLVAGMALSFLVGHDDRPGGGRVWGWLAGAVTAATLLAMGLAVAAYLRLN
jgi:rhomboid protease GluP